MSSAEHSKAVGLLLLIHSLFLPPVCVWGGYGLSLFCFALLCFWFCNHLAGKKVSWLLYFNCLLS